MASLSMEENKESIVRFEEVIELCAAHGEPAVRLLLGDDVVDIAKFKHNICQQFAAGVMWCDQGERAALGLL